MAYLGAGITRFNTADDLTVTGDAQIDTNTFVVDSTNNRVGILNASPATALDVTGTLTADDIVLSGGVSKTGDLTFDVSGDISLDADGGDIRLLDGGTQFGKFTRSSGDFIISASENDKDMKFAGADGGADITALTLDMSAAGAATFNSFIYLDYIRGKSDTNTGINIAGSDALSFQTGGVNRLNITSGGYLEAVSASQVRLTLGSEGTAGSNTANWIRGNGTSLGFNSASGGFQFEIGGTERMRINSSGNVHITDNTNGPDAALHIEKTTPQLRLQLNGNSGYNTIESGGSNELIIGRSGTEQLRVLSGGGLTFNGDTATANALDDYEEGTWTPTLPSGGSLSVGKARYVKIGNYVNLSFYVTSIDPTAGNSVFKIGGLPFTVLTDTSYYVGGTIGYTGDNNLNDVMILTGTNLDYLYFHLNDGDGGAVTNTEMRDRGLTGASLDAMIASVSYTSA